MVIGNLALARSTYVRSTSWILDLSSASKKYTHWSSGPSFSEPHELRVGLYPLGYEKKGLIEQQTLSR